MESAAAADLAEWTDEALLEAYRDLARRELSLEEKAFFVEVIGERNSRQSKAAQEAWLADSLSYAIRSRRPA